MPGRGRDRQEWCGKGLHNLNDPENVYVSRDPNRPYVKRQCRPCALMRGRRNKRPGRPVIGFRPTAQELAVLQLLADGLTYDEIAERLYLSPLSIRNTLHSVRRKYGVRSTPAAVAQALKRSAIRPDRATAKRLRKTLPRRYILSVRALIQDERKPFRAQDRRLSDVLDNCLSWTESHAVSVLWAAGHITNKHVPQTRNGYRRAPKRKEDAEEWTSKKLAGV